MQLIHFRFDMLMVTAMWLNIIQDDNIYCVMYVRCAVCVLYTKEKINVTVIKCRWNLIEFLHWLMCVWYLCSLKCLYCEKIFKDGATLKEHMRKKRHKRLHSSNADYRRFYIASYLVCIKVMQLLYISIHLVGQYWPDGWHDTASAHWCYDWATGTASSL